MTTRSLVAGLGLTLAVLIAALALVLRSQASSAQGIPAPTATPRPGAASAVRVPLGPPPAVIPMTDLASSLPARNKAVVYAQRRDGSEEGFFVAPQQVNAFIHHLPSGDTLITASPPESIAGAYPTAAPAGSTPPSSRTTTAPRSQITATPVAPPVP